MATIEEIDHLFTIGNSGLVQYTDEQALQDRIQEWLETPEGTIADMPWWGHNLAGLKHEPIGLNLRVLAETMMVRKMLLDIKNLQLRGVAILPVEIDRITIVVDYSMGSYVTEVTL